MDKKFRTGIDVHTRMNLQTLDLCDIILVTMKYGVICITIDSTCFSVAVTPFARVGQEGWSYGKGRAGNPFCLSFPGRSIGKGPPKTSKTGSLSVLIDATFPGQSGARTLDLRNTLKGPRLWPHRSGGVRPATQEGRELRRYVRRAKSKGYFRG